MKQEWEKLTCQTCGEEETLSYFKDVIKTLKEHKMCFSCNFWRERVISYNNDSDHRIAVIDGDMYYLSTSNNSDSQWNGFGGRKFKVLFNDGTVVETNDMSHNGTIDELFRSQLPDNAKFEEVEQRNIEHGQGYYRNSF